MKFSRFVLLFVVKYKNKYDPIFDTCEKEKKCKPLIFQWFHSFSPVLGCCI